MKGREGYDGDPGCGLEGGAGQQASLTASGWSAPPSPAFSGLFTKGSRLHRGIPSPGEILREGSRLTIPTANSVPRSSSPGPNELGPRVGMARAAASQLPGRPSGELAAPEGSARGPGSQGGQAGEGRAARSPRSPGNR